MNCFLLFYSEFTGIFVFVLKMKFVKQKIGKLLKMYVRRNYLTGNCEDLAKFCYYQEKENI